MHTHKLSSWGRLRHMSVAEMGREGLDSMQQSFQVLICRQGGFTQAGSEPVGSTLMPYLEAILGYLSVSIFTTLTFPFISSAIPCSKQSSVLICRQRKTITQPCCMPTQAPDLPEVLVQTATAVSASHPALACRCAGMTHPQGITHELARPAPLRMEVHKHGHITTPNHLLKAGKLLRLHCFYCHCC